MARSPGSAIGRYQIVGFLARGETSIVYEALEPELGRQVALKILPPSAARDSEQVDQFLRLATRLSKLDHANLLPVIDYGRHDGVPFVVLPIVGGGSLADHLGAYRELEQALPLVVALAQAVDYLHRNQLVHGRIAPRHVLLDDQGEPLLTGLAWHSPSAGPAAPTAGPSAPSFLAPPFLAPEQHQGQAPDERTDVFQLGALLYYLMLGYPPEPDSEADMADVLDEDIAAILARATAADPDDRFQNAAELGDHLTAAERRRSGQEPEEDLSDEDLSDEDLSDEDLPAQAIAEAAPAQPRAVPETVAPVFAAYGHLRENNPLFLVVALVGLVIVLGLCCLLAGYAGYKVSGRLGQPRATAQVDTNIRVGPGIAYPIVGLLRQGQQADISGVSPDGNWWQIAFPGAPNGKGWVPAAFVKVDRLGSVTVIEPPPLPSEATLPQSPLPLAVVAPLVLQAGERQ